ncbi:MAG TPA: YARHG domain-containing protein [Pyrinomonadaceae bacterium]|nr:YARHG domain-containing protein [Chloracidobacterium sp.]MBP9934763.1 YARHG domain-containing protein [Pyrinomonadaceae bacterium]MBK7803206.1 YARHG domain-containing protein [Chloracidobacterium sp.]MBK9438149.1 YARHG domain-containing protein [Chloracidobacterium sp.]MBK9767546.1 YARHG domain-containing protein [Chloracidobacterium sp.]
MKNLVLLLIATTFLFGCSVQKTAEKTTDKFDDTAANNSMATAANAPTAAAGDAVAQEILGSYVGTFGDNKITLLITSISGNTISGRSIVGGNDRPFDGTFALENGSYVVSGKEPGDHKDDGAFKFNIAKSNINELVGTWKANDTKRPEKSYKLERRKFEYRAGVGNWPQASKRLLKPADVENLPKGELEFMRNEIFARHGYCFKKKELRQQFENEDWYIPNTVDIKNYLTDIEKTNIALIKRYEKYADEYGDEYGR